MIVDKICLKNYRNYDNLKLKFNKGINIIIGTNGIGKTNILESLYFLSVTKSFRTSNDLILIQQNKKFSSVCAKIKNNNIPKNIEIIFSKDSKKLLINNNNIKKVSDFIGAINTVIISPDDVDILKGTPSDRRNLFNIELSKLNKQYINKYNEYNKILKMRNDYLKLLMTNSIADERYFEILTDRLIERAIYIYIERKKLIDNINKIIGDIYLDISELPDLNIFYKTNIDIDSFEYELLRKKLKHQYYKYKNKEISLGITLYGPHRDDFEFNIKDDNIKYYASQGQQKLVAIAVKLAFMKIYKDECNDVPILLLDDIFSELDRKRRNKLINYINNFGQVIITTNDIRDIDKKKINTAKIFEIKNNKIIEKVI